ncbi:MAG TPA: cohesin domain-containing protein [Anaerolineae bacterium]|nr:cohesin domain-containing protein [Anaerolineae bacterium]
MQDNHRRADLIASGALAAWCALAACAPAQPTATVESATTSVKVDPKTATIAQAEVVGVSIRVEQVSDLLGAEFHLQFDPTVLEVIDDDTLIEGVQIAHGELLHADLVPENRVDNAAGTIDYAIVQINRAAIAGSGVLATIHFKGKAPGVALITFRSVPAAPQGIVLADSRGKAISGAAETGSLTVE